MLIEGTNKSRDRRINMWATFETIRRLGPISRSDIAQETGLSKQAISNIVDELQTSGLLREHKRIASGIGKPSTPLTINADGAFTIGLHLDFGRLFLVAMDLGGTVLYRETHALETVTPDGTLETLVRLVRGALQRAEESDDFPARLLGIGLAMPGLFGVEGLGPTRLRDWNGVLLRQKLEQRLRLPVSFTSDSTGAAIAEWRFGAARKLSSFVYVFIGNGVGTGTIIDGHAVVGATGNAGDFGHIIVQPGGHPCVCGKRGCLETYISSGSALEFLGREGLTAPILDDIEPAAANQRLGIWLEQSAEPFRIGLNAVENILDPETIIIGGDAPAWLLNQLFEKVQPLYPSPAKRARSTDRLMRGAFGQDVSAIGAAAMPVIVSLDPTYHSPELTCDG